MKSHQLTSVKEELKFNNQNEPKPHFIKDPSPFNKINSHGVQENMDSLEALKTKDSHRVEETDASNIKTSKDSATSSKSFGDSNNNVVVFFSIFLLIGAAAYIKSNS